MADRTFPQPTLPGIPPQEVSTAVAVLIDLLLKEQAKENANWEQRDAQRVEELVQACLWKRDGLLHLKVYQAEGSVHMRDSEELHLPARVLTPQERKTLTDACSKELVHANGALEILSDFVTFCQLLRQPENHVKSATPVYAEREVNTYTTAEMTNQVARELMNLPPRTAYAKVVSLAPGSESMWKGKIQTLALEETRASVGDVSTLALRHAIAHGILKLRSDIDKEIRERQENWRRRRGNEPPPPTSTGGNTPPSSGSTGNDLSADRQDREPPPTRSIPEKASEEKSSSNAGERLVCSSNFYSPDPLWDESTSSNTRAFRREGYYHIAVNHTQSSYYHFPTIPLADFRVHVDAGFSLNSSTHGSYGILFRASHVGNNEKHYNFLISSHHYLLSLFDTEDNNYKALINWCSSEFIKGAYSTNSLMVEMVEQKITVGVNGHILATVMDSNLVSGHVGLCVNSGIEAVEARFRDFRLYSIERNKPIMKQIQNTDDRAVEKAIKYGIWLG